jgi:Flp pilus assembly protein CpaB
MNQTATQTRPPRDPVQPPVKPRRFKTRRLTPGHLIPLLLAIAAGIAVLVVLQQRNATVSIAVVRTEIPAGSLIDASNTRLVQVRASDVALTDGLMRGAQLDQRWVASVDLNAGEPIARSEIGFGGGDAGLGAMSIQVPTDHAAGGSILAGDRVDVLSTSGSGGAFYVAQALRVLSVAQSGNGGLLGADVGDYWIVVAVDKTTALHLTAALGSGASSTSTGIEVVRSNGEAEDPQSNYRPEPQVPQSTAPATAAPNR